MDAHITRSEPIRQARGFAALSEEKRRSISSMGGKAAHAKGTAHEFTTDEARTAGSKGGKAVSRNRAHMSKIGRVVGAKASRSREHMAARGRKGGRAPRVQKEAT